jgi:hypothetical protein
LTLQPWETAWPANPASFIQPSVGEAPAWNIDEARTEEWNVSLQFGLPFKSALEVSYVGVRMSDQVAMHAYNEVAPGSYPDLQAAKPYPAFGQINVLENLGKSWYNGLQMKWERRFSEGLAFTASYAFGKNLGENMPQYETDRLIPFAPTGYTRGRTAWDRTHILFVSTVYELPFGRGRRFGSDVNKITNLVLGGWQLSGINSFTSGAPLTVFTPGATLGNGWDTRANLVGDPSNANQSASSWFNTAAFASPGAFRFGNSGMGLMDGPGSHILDLGLMKSFYVTESKYFQFRWEAFNALNHVNLGNPGTTLGTADFGRITSAGGARTMQVGLKFLF